jgi:hypothetical protein
MPELTETEFKLYRQRAALKSFDPQLQLAREIPRGQPVDLLYEIVSETISRDTCLRYLEFGVYGGHSMRKMCNNFTNTESEFVGFDSFEGLPEDWAHYQRGMFSTEGVEPHNQDTRVQFVKGWFQNTLPGYLANTRGRAAKSTLVHFDADLYSSTLFLLTSLWPEIPEYYFIFDEFYLDEVVALRDFATAFPAKIEFFGRTAGPMQVFGKLTRTPFTLV